MFNFPLLMTRVSAHVGLFDYTDLMAPEGALGAWVCRRLEARDSGTPESAGTSC